MFNRKIVILCALLLMAALSFAEDAAQQFTLQDLNGKVYDLSQALGKNTIVLNFWASWCASCKEEIPQLKALMEAKGADNAVFLGINAGENEKKAKRFVEKYEYPYLVLIDKDKSVSKKYSVMGLPSTIIISKDKKIIFRGPRPPKGFGN